MKRLLLVCGLTLALLTTLVIAVQAGHTEDITPQNPSWPTLPVRAHIEPTLLKRLLAAKPDERVPLIVTLRDQEVPPLESAGAASRAAFVGALQAAAQTAQRDVRAYLAAEQAAGRVEGVQSFWIFNGLALHAAPQTAWALAARPDVALIQLDAYRQWVTEPPGASEGARSGAARVEWGVQRIRADQVWSAFNITGTGVSVASMDTGVDFLHPALNGNYRGNLGKGLYRHAGNWFDATSAATVYPMDGLGHGTHTMGTLAGQGGIGVAPGARWIAARVLDSQGYGYDSWIHAGFQWMLAPGGDPAQAPNVLNNSWGNSDGALTTFQEDIARLRAAGIITIFSAGNTGPASGSVGSPASLPGVFSVGALDADNAVAGFSSRGPSPWQETKPDVAAPGVGIRSAVPGGIYELNSGTSMAAPHVAGIAALLVAAHPGLSVAAAESALTHTAVALSTTVPNNDSGWGRVDAYRAVQEVAQAGILAGSVIDAASRLPLSGAQVTAYNYTTGLSFTVQTGAGGHFEVALASGAYRVTAALFGYTPDEAPRLTVVAGQTTVHDFMPAPRPVGILRGVLTDTVSGRAASATISVAGTPLSQAATGQYQLALPAGAYEVEVKGLGYRVATATVTVRAGAVTEHGFGLVPAPRILLVNTGAWYYQDYTAYYRQALDDLGYVYQTRAIKDVLSDTPTITDMLKFDVVIWSSPKDSPGYVGADRALAQYLAGGHSLILSGQDVAFWDGGGTGVFYAPYLEQQLKTTYVADDSGQRSLSGVPNDFMAGLSFAIEGGGGANNQQWPDEIAVADADHAAQVLAYQGDGTGGNKVGLCLPYRAVFLSFGYEAITEPARRRDAMQRMLDYLASPRQRTGLGLSAVSPDLQIGQPGSVVTFTARAHNTGEAGNDVTYGAALSGAGWTATVSPTRFTLAPCATSTLTVQVTIPAGTPINTRKALRLTVRPLNGASPTQAITLTAKTPAPLLLIDDGRWYEGKGAYTSALDQLRLAYDVWSVPRSGPLTQLYGPPAARLRWYSQVLWFTGYDWYLPLTAYDEQQLASYLNGGGRLLLSSPFYLDSRGDSAFAHERLGVITYTYGMTATHGYGSPGHPLGAGMGLVPLINPFPRAGFSTLDGVIVPSAQTATVWRGDHDRAEASARPEAGNRLVFWDIPLEALPADTRLRVLGRTLGWLGPLGDSAAGFTPSTAANGQPVTLALSVHNNSAGAQAAFTATLPATFAPDPSGIPPGLAYDSHAGTLAWHGWLAADATLSFSVRGRAQAANGGTTAGAVVFHENRLGLNFDQPLRLPVDGADLQTSKLLLPAGSSSTRPKVSMVLRNNGPGQASAVVAKGVVPLPSQVLPGSISVQGPGTARASSEGVTWQGTLARGQAVTVTFTLSTSLSARRVALPVEMLATDGSGGAWEWRGWLEATWRRVNFWPFIGQ